MRLENRAGGSRGRDYVPSSKLGFPIPACRCPFGAWPVIGLKFEKSGLSRFALLPILKLLATQIAQALPAERVAVDDKNVWLRHDRSLSLLVMGCIC